ncbi:FHA domain-containing protein [Aggregatilinea lenta]|uniref:FHA domain-containing protein n=1 Tax=Aggregatilinea lenta TaxID=913108 RepID=UPI000E5A11FD|nr:FHA domain-containing protein [Aggregatilinea lenta]
MQGNGSFRLIVRRGPQPNQVYELNKGIITIGRDITNDIVINDPEVSRHHARLTQTGAGYTLEDLGSTNGTFVNGQRLTGARPLANGDMVGMGETVTLAYEAMMPASYADPGRASTMVNPAQQNQNIDYAPAPSVGYAQPQPEYAQPGYAQPQPYAAQQAPGGYEYDYQDENYESSGMSRWLILGCGCFLVLCIMTSVISVIVIDSQCLWGDIPVVSDMFNLGVKDGACQ